MGWRVLRPEAGTHAAVCDPSSRKRRLIRDVFMLICTCLGFSSFYFFFSFFLSERAFRVERKKFWRTGNFRKA